MKNNLLTLILLVSSFLGLQAQNAAQKEDITFGNDIQMAGSLGETQQIAVYLQPILEEDREPGSCFEVRGHYWDLSTLHAVKLNGTLCPSEGSISLFHGKGSDFEESFTGNLTTGTANWEGSWKKGEQTAQFSLPMLMPEQLWENQVRFTDFIKLRMGRDGVDPAMDDASVANAGMTPEKYSFIDGFDGEMDCEITFFNESRLNYNVIDQFASPVVSMKYTLQLTPDKFHIIHLVEWDNLGEKNEYGYRLTIYAYEFSKWTEIEGLPEGVPAHASGEWPEWQGGDRFHASMDKETLRLHVDGQDHLLHWNGEQFVFVK